MAEIMICLDTYYLILGLVPGSRESKDLIACAQAGETLTAPQIAAMRAFLHDLVPFHEPRALEAARLFNASKRKRSPRIDAMIAATAIVAGAELATNNRADFNTFVPHGPKLA